MERNQKICVIGAGISGLSLSYYLKKKGYKNITILEKSNRVGGKCFSLKYKGKVYEMGAQMGFYSNHNLTELLNDFNIKEIGPVLYRSYFDSKGNPVSQIQSKEIDQFQKQFYKLLDILPKYKSIWKPGFKNINPDLYVPFRKWLIQNDIPLVEKVYAPPFNGYGYGFFDEIAAVYVLKYLNLEILNSFIETTHLITLVDGFQTLCEKMAAFLDNIKLNTNILSIKRGDNITIKTQLETLNFDKLILTCPLDETLDFLDATEEEENLFSKILYNDFYVFAYSLDNIPKVCGYIPENFSRKKIGHLTVWYYRWQNINKNNLVTVYANGNNALDKDIKRKVEKDLLNLGVKINNLYTYTKWKYFPHISCEDLKNKYYEKLENIQSKNNTYYAGEIMSFSIIEECLRYSKDLVDTYF